MEKGRESALDGIPHRMSALSRAHKVIARARSHGLAPAGLGLAPAAVAAEAIGAELLALVGRAEELGIDPEQAARAALRQLEGRVLELERRSAGGADDPSGQAR